MKKSLFNAIRFLAATGLLIVLSFTVICYFGTLHRHFEIASHFNMQYMAAKLRLCSRKPLRTNFCPGSDFVHNAKHKNTSAE
jgi:hypothetical protein